MRIHITVSVSLAILLATDGVAQQSVLSVPKDTAKWTTGATQLRAGRMSLGLGVLNADLARNSRPTFSNSIPTFGFSTYARRGWLLYGASAEGSLAHRAVEGGWLTRLSGGTATLDVGVVLINASSTFVYSMASVGMRGTSLHFERKGDFTYSEGLADPARALDLASKSGIMQVGLSAERRFQTRRTIEFSLALQWGITRPFGSSSTDAGESRVRQTPELGRSSFVRVAFSRPLARRARVLDTVGAALLSLLAW